jgi:outer membrane receptor for ferrienterochelin and colicin
MQKSCIYNIAVFLLTVHFHFVSGQTDTTQLFRTERYLLGASDIIEHKDTSEVKIISVSRSSKYISDLPVTIHLVTHEEIINNQYTSLADILKSLPGIKVSQPGSGETGETYQVRGLTGNFYTKILINGIPIKPSAVTGMPVGAQLPIRQAERVEVIYGPSAAVYGADAVSGVINIITREADKGTFAQGDISLGENEYNYINFMIGGKAGKNKNILQYSFYGSKSEFNNMNIKYDIKKFYNPLNYFIQLKKQIVINGNSYEPSDIVQNGIENLNITHNKFKELIYYNGYEGDVFEPEMEELASGSHMIGLNLRYRGIEISYNNMYRRTHSSIGKNTFLYKYNNPQNYWGENIHRATLSYKKEWKRILFSTNLSSLSYRLDNNTSLGLTFIENRDMTYLYSASDDFFAEQLLTIYPFKNLEIVTGISYQASQDLPLTNYLKSPFNPEKYKIYNPDDLPVDSLLGRFGWNPLNYNTGSVFMQGYFVKDKFRIMGGLRFDDNSRYGINFSPRFASLYKISNRTSARAFIGYAYKAPPASMVFESLAYPAGENADSIYYVVVPASLRTDIMSYKLKPEKFESYELGVNSKIFWDIDADIAIFYNAIKNHFSLVKLDKSAFDLPLAINDSILTKENAENKVSRLYGLQLTLRKNNIIKSIRLDAEINVAFSKKGENIPELEALIESFKLMPSHIGHLKVSFYPLKNLYIHFENTWETKWLRVLIPIEDLYKDLFRNVDGYYTVDAVASYEISNSLRAYIKVINLFNEQYSGLNASSLIEDIPYNPQLGRNIRLGLTYTLN